MLSLRGFLCNARKRAIWRFEIMYVDSRTWDLVGAAPILLLNPLFVVE